MTATVFKFPLFKPSVSKPSVSKPNIAAKDSLGVFAECPHCHSPIQHGFQVCGNCGHPVSAREQQALRNLLKKNVAVHVGIFVVSIGVGLAVVRWLLQ